MCYQRSGRKRKDKIFLRRLKLSWMKNIKIWLSNTNYSPSKRCINVVQWVSNVCYQFKWNWTSNTWNRLWSWSLIFLRKSTTHILKLFVFQNYKSDTLRELNRFIKKILTLYFTLFSNITSLKLGFIYMFSDLLRDY